MHKYENKFPSGIGFVNETVEVFVVRENLFSKLFRPHFHLYNHATEEIRSVRFDQLDSCSQEVLTFLGTTRAYSLDRKRFLLPRTYYEDLVAEWEIINKWRIARRFLWI